MAAGAPVRPADDLGTTPMVINFATAALTLFFNGNVILKEYSEEESHQSPLTGSLGPSQEHVLGTPMVINIATAALML